MSRQLKLFSGPEQNTRRVLAARAAPKPRNTRRLPTKASTDEAALENANIPVSTTPGLPPYETVALVLQGGGALGAYQAGVFQGLHEAGRSEEHTSELQSLMRRA